jgi:hypothetical protein
VRRAACTDLAMMMRSALLSAALVLCWAASGKAQVHTCADDGFCETYVAAGGLGPAGSAGESGAVHLSTPANNQVFKISENRITALAHDLTEEYVTFHVFVESGNDVTFEYGSRILDDGEGWCTELPQRHVFAGESCHPRHRKREDSQIGGLDAWIVTVKTDFNDDSGEMRDMDSKVCFTHESASGGTRCVYLRGIPAPTAPVIYVDGVGGVEGEKNWMNNELVTYVGNDETLPLAQQGYESHFEVRAASKARALQVEIGFAQLRTLQGRAYAELPGQRWSGPTTCRATGSLHGPCDEWTRTLLFTPTVVQKDKEYLINFQASTKFPDSNEFSLPEGLSGIACAGEIGVCKNGTDVTSFMQNEMTTVRVVPWTPKIVFSKAKHEFIMDEVAGGTGAGRLLKPVPNRTAHQLDPPVRGNPVIMCAGEPSSAISAGEDYPESCIQVPHPAYVNCPMRPFSVVAEMECAGTSGQTHPPVCAAATKPAPSQAQQEDSKAAITEATADLKFVIASAKSRKGDRDAVALGLRLSERLFVEDPIKKVGQDNPPDGADSEVKFLAHVAVMWTPPMEAMGSVFDVCVDAKSAKSSARRCVAVEVKRCFYCR